MMPAATDDCARNCLRVHFCFPPLNHRPPEAPGSIVRHTAQSASHVSASFANPAEGACGGLAGPNSQVPGTNNVLDNATIGALSDRIQCNE
jgi:hypothetical protein